MGSNPTSSEVKNFKMFFQLQIVSKDKQVLKKFLHFLLKLQKISSTWNIISNFNKKDVITVLKSPHVNKTPQEPFEYRIYSKKILITSFKPLIFLLTLKKLKKLSFSGILLKVTKLSNNSKMVNRILYLLTPGNIVLKKVVNKRKLKDYLGFSKYIQLFDCYGEILLKTKYM